MKCTAIRDGDDYLINGQKIFVGSTHGADQFWTIVVTDPEGARHQNLGWIMIPSGLPGISVAPMDLLISGGNKGNGSGIKQTVYFDNVRVPGFNLVGGENEGWKVAQTHLELEHGTGGMVARDRLVDRLIEYCKETKRNDRPISKDSDARDLLVELYIDAEVGRLFGLRNYWLRHSGKPVTYEGPQLSFHRKTSGLRMGKTILELLGPYALTNDPQWGIAEGHIEAHQRSSIVDIHPGATTDIQKVIMARRMGVGRATKEKAGTLA